MSLILSVQRFSSSRDIEWDLFCQNSWNGTFLQSRRFLNYHQDRFEDFSFLIYLENQLVGLAPFARDRDDYEHVISHPGTSFGGIVRASVLNGELLTSAFRLLRDELVGLGFEKLTVKHVPLIYHMQPSQDEVFSMWALGGSSSKTLLSSTIDLRSEVNKSSRRKRGLNLAVRSGLSIVEGFDWLGKLWKVVERNLAERYGVKPVHNLDEIRKIAELFPENVLTFAAISSDKVVAGTIIFRSNLVWHAQYIASSDLGRACSALDYVFEEVIAKARKAGARYFDFGVSNERDGITLNEGLYKFKSEFGAGGLAVQSSSLFLRNYG